MSIKHPESSNVEEGNQLEETRKASWGRGNLWNRISKSQIGLGLVSGKKGMVVRVLWRNKCI